jgi:hypothetical protein
MCRSDSIPLESFLLRRVLHLAGLILLVFFACAPAGRAAEQRVLVGDALDAYQVAFDQFAVREETTPLTPETIALALAAGHINAQTGSAKSTRPFAAPGTDVLAINCGGAATGSWVADEYYGSAIGAAQVTTPISTAGVTNPAPQAVYDSIRFPTSGPMTYTIPGFTAGATYTVRLHFAAFFDTAPGQRVFDVSINGTQVLTNFDVFATAGADTAVVETFNTVANASGQIVVLFTNVTNVPIINGIEIQTPAAPAAPGGVTGATLWFAGSGYNGATWTDQSGSGAVSAQPVAASGYASPTALSLDANFNPGVSYNGSTQELMGSTSTAMFAEGNSYIFGVANSSVYAPSGASFGDILSGNVNWFIDSGQGILYSAGAYGVDTSGANGAGPFTIPTATTVLSDVAYPVAGSATNALSSENGLTQATSLANGVFATTRFEIGARTSGGSSCGCQGRLFAGKIDEVIYYNNLSSPLTSVQIAQIRSYLALKYGITLGLTTSPGSDGTSRPGWISAFHIRSIRRATATPSMSRSPTVRRSARRHSQQMRRSRAIKPSSFGATTANR